MLTHQAAPTAEPYAARRDPDGHEPIEGWRILLQHHNIVTGEAIVASNVIKQRHRAARRSARRPAASRTTSSERSRPRLPRTEPSALFRSEALRQRMAAVKRRTQRRADTMPASAHTAARIHRRSGPPRRSHAPSNSPGGRQAVRHSGDRAEQHADQDRVHTEQDALTERTRCGAVFETAARTHRQRRTHPDAHLQERRRVQRLQPWEQEQEPTRSRSGRSPRRAAHSS